MQRSIEEDHQAILLEADAPVQVAGVPAELQSGLCICGLEAPDGLLAETGDDGTVRIDVEQRAIRQRLVAVEADGAIGAAIGGEAEALATGIGGRHEE